MKHHWRARHWSVHNLLSGLHAFMLADLSRVSTPLPFSSAGPQCSCWGELNLDSHRGSSGLTAAAHPASPLCWCSGSTEGGKRHCWKSLWVSTKMSFREWVARSFVLFFTPWSAFEKVFGSCLEYDIGHSDTEKKAVAPLPCFSSI